MEILTKTDFDFDIWNNSPDPNFTEISLKSMIPMKWVSFLRVSSGEYSDSVIKPINKYVEQLYPAPELVWIENGIVTLRQYSHAGVYLLEKDSILKALDRPWMRQFYKSKISFPEDQSCFDEVFVFYVPWFIDAHIGIRFNRVPQSAFVVYPTSSHYASVKPGTHFVEPLFVPFRFSKVGPHMNRDGFGKIPKGEPMFDMVFQADDTIIERVRKFYEQD